MSCEGYLEQISARLDGELTAQEEKQLADHLCTCPRCRAIAEELEGLHGALGELEQIQPPAELSGRVMEQIRRGKQRHKQTSRRRTFRQLAGLAACLLLFVGVYRLDHSGTQREWNVADEKYAVARPETADQVYTADSAEAPDGDQTSAVQEQLLQTTAKTAVPAIGAQITADAAAPGGAPAHYFFCNDRYIRVSGVDGLEMPSARILGSTASLTGFAAHFPETDLSQLTQQYDDEFFKTGQLLAVVLEEGSGSIRHKIESQGLFQDRVVIRRIVPEVGTADMACWLILAEVDTMFSEGRQMQVETKNQP